MRNKKQFIEGMQAWLFFCSLIASTCLASTTPLDALWNALGSPTDISGQSTLWGQLKQRAETISADEQAVWGRPSETSPTTLFGRVNMLMHQLAFLENNSLDVETEAVLQTLQGHSNSLVERIGTNVSLGSWFDSSDRDTLFGGLARTSQALFQRTNLFDSISTQEQTLANKAQHEASLLFFKLCPYFSSEDLEATKVSIDSLILQPNIEDNWTNLLKAWGSVYHHLRVGTSKEPSNTQSEAPLFALLNTLKTDLSDQIFDAASNSLLELYAPEQGRQYIPNTLEQWLSFLSFTGEPGDNETLAAELNLADSVGSPFLEVDFDSDEATSPTFFSVFQHLKERVWSSKEKKDALLQGLGQKNDALGETTVFGQLARFEVEPSSAETALLKMLLINGPRDSFGRSFASELVELRSLLSQVAETLPTDQLNRLLRTLGRYGHRDPETLFGAVHCLIDVMDDNGESFLTALGVEQTHQPPREEDYSPSCWKTLEAMRRLCAPMNLSNALPQWPSVDLWWERFSLDSHMELLSLLKTRTLDERVFRSLLCKEFQQKITGAQSLLTQVQKLQNHLEEDSLFEEALFRLAPSVEPTNVLDDWHLTSRLQRLSSLLSTMKDWMSFDLFDCLYDLLFANFNSLQNRLYEVEISSRTQPASIPHLIGSIESLDESLFGLVNQALTYVEVTPFVSVLARSKEMEKELIVKSQWLTAAELRRVTSWLGDHERPLSPHVDKLFDLFPYLSHLLRSTYFLRPFKDFPTLIDFFFERNSSKNNLTYMINKWFQSADAMDIYFLDGYAASLEDPSLWTVCQSIFSVLTNELKAAFDPSQFTLISSSLYEKRYAVLKALLTVSEKDYVKLDVEKLIHLIFNSQLIQQDLRHDLLSAATATAEPRKPILTWELISQTNDEEELVTLLDLALHTLIVTPLLDLLVPNPGFPEEVSNLSAQCHLQRITTRIQDWSAFIANEIRFVGDLSTPLTFSTTDSPTLCGLFQELINLVREPIFFVPLLLPHTSTQDSSLPEEGVQDEEAFFSEKNMLQIVRNSWLLLSLNNVGTPYSEESSIMTLTFFETLFKVQEILQTDNIMTTLTSFRMALGTPESTSTDKYHSCFSMMFSILKNALDQIVPFSLQVTESKILYVKPLVKKIASLLDLLKHPEYGYSAIYKSLSRIGTLEPPTNLFLQCLNFATNWTTASELNFAQTAALFLVGHREATCALNDFIAILPTTGEQECEAFIMNLTIIINQMIGLKACDGCRAVLSPLNSIRMNLEDLTSLLNLFSDQEKIEVFSVAFLDPIRIHGESCQTALHRLSELYGVNQRESGCGFVSATGDTSIVSELTVFNKALNGIVENLKETTSSLQLPSIEPSQYKPMATVNACEGVVTLIKPLTSQILAISMALSVPAKATSTYVSQNEKSLAALLLAARSMFEDLKKLLKSPCEPCLKADLTTKALAESVEFLISQLAALHQWVHQSSLSQLAYQLDKIRQNLEVLLAYSVLPQTPTQLFQYLKNPRFGEQSESEISVLKQVPEFIKTLIQNFSTKPIVVDQAFSVLTTLEKALQKEIDIWQAWSLQWGGMPDTSKLTPVPLPSYSEASLPEIFEKLFENVKQLYAFWSQFTAYIQSFSDGFPNPWLYHWLKEKESFHEQLAPCFVNSEGTPLSLDFFINDSTFFKDSFPLIWTQLAELFTHTQPKTTVPSWLMLLQKTTDYLQTKCPHTFLESVSTWSQCLNQLVKNISTTQTEEEIQKLVTTFLPHLTRTMKRYNTVLEKLLRESHLTCLHHSAETFVVFLANRYADLLGDNFQSTAFPLLPIDKILDLRKNTRSLLNAWLQQRLSLPALNVHDAETFCQLSEFIQECTAIQSQVQQLSLLKGCQLNTSDTWRLVWEDEAAFFELCAQSLQELLVVRQTQHPCLLAMLEELQLLKTTISQLTLSWTHWVQIAFSNEPPHEVLQESTVADALSAFRSVMKTTASLFQPLNSSTDHHDLCWCTIQPDVQALIQSLNSLNSLLSRNTNVITSANSPVEDTFEDKLQSIVQTVLILPPMIQEATKNFSVTAKHLPYLPHLFGFYIEVQRLTQMLNQVSTLLKESDIHLEGVSLQTAIQPLKCLVEGLQTMAHSVYFVCAQLREQLRNAEHQKASQCLQAHLSTKIGDQIQTVRALTQQEKEAQSKLTALIHYWLDRNYRPTKSVEHSIPFKKVEDVSLFPNAI